MSEYTYTAKDFAAAEFAIDPSVSGWVRCVDDERPWRNPNSGEWASAKGMVAKRCIPVYAEPYSPEALQRAWEHGEKPKPDEKTTEGMVTASAVDGAFGKTLAVHANQAGGPLFSFERIIYRPPETDPVTDLAQAMEDVLPEEAGSPAALRRYAEALVEYGVRVTDDDE